MATTSNKDYDSLAGTFTSTYQDTVTQRYKVKFDSAQTSPNAVLAAAQTASPDPVPLRGERPAATHLFAKQFHVAPDDESRLLWYITVTYSAPEPGEGEDQQNANPLLRPAILNVEYMETEYVVTKAKNTVELPHGDGKGNSRAADTEGPIVNAAGKRPDEPIVDTERNAVLVVSKNYAALSDIIDLNKTYAKSTNSDEPEGFDKRTLKYMLTESLGKQSDGGADYWPGVTRIEVKDTTDIELDNGGLMYWEGGKLKTAVDSDGDSVSEPISLKIDGSKGGDNTTTITWRHLAEKAYAPLLS